MAIDDQKDRLAVAIIIFELILKYGVPMALKMAESLQKDDPTLADWIALRDRVHHPSYYEEGA